ncbi:zinc finger protein 275-like isoform X2 [Armigeres subalbatus]
MLGKMMNCTICYESDEKLTLIEADLAEEHRLCKRCLNDLFTAELGNDPSGDSDDSKAHIVIKCDPTLENETQEDLPISIKREEEYLSEDNVSIKSEPGEFQFVSEVNSSEEDQPAANPEPKPEPLEKGKLKCSFCDERCNNRRAMAAHMDICHPEEKINRCRICLLFFKGAKQFDQHVQDEHDGFTHSCGICMEGYERGKKQEHEKMCLGRLIFECVVCNERYVSKDGLEKHLDCHQTAADRESPSEFNRELRSFEKIYTCTLCEDDKSYQENLYWNHIHEAHDGRHLQCPDCGKTFRNRKHLLVHAGLQCKVSTKALRNAAKVNKPEPSKCTECSKSFRTRTLLLSHIAKLHKVKSVVCHLCGLCLPNKYLFRYHRLKFHTEASIKCPKCPKQFHLAGDLKQHLVTHDTTGKLVCEECGRLFKRKLGLDLHMKTHQKSSGRAKRKEVPDTSGKHVCEVCDRRFKHNYLLVAHAKTHDPDRHLHKTIPCTLCDKKFETSAGLYYHMKGKYVHQRMTCSVCNVVIKGKEKYAKHLATHTEAT